MFQWYTLLYSLLHCIPMDNAFALQNTIFPNVVAGSSYMYIDFADLVPTIFTHPHVVYVVLDILLLAMDVV